MSADYPAWISVPEKGPPAVEVNWAALPEGWRARSYRVRLSAETPDDYADRIRACVAEGLAPADALAFAAHLVGGPDAHGTSA